MHMHPTDVWSNTANPCLMSLHGRVVTHLLTLYPMPWTALLRLALSSSLADDGSMTTAAGQGSDPCKKM
jgi:hypothetical protein